MYTPEMQKETYKTVLVC